VAERTQQLLLAEGLTRQMQTAPAIEACQRVLAVDGSDPFAHALLAELFDRTGFWERAVAHATKAIEHDPGCLPAYLSLGSAYGALSDSADQAILVFHELAELVPDSPVPQALLGDAYMAIYHTDEALEALERASELDAGWSRPQFSAALAYQMRGDATREGEAWSKARERDRAGEDLFFGLNRIPDVDPTRAPVPDPPWPEDLQERLRLAEALLRADMLNDAAAVAKSVLSERPESDRALGDLAAVYIRQEMTNEAMILARRAFDLNGGNLGARHILATTYRRRPRLLAAAAELWEGIVAAEPRHAVVHALVGETRLDLGDEEAGVAALFKSIDIDPRQPRPLYALASLYLAGGMHAEARLTMRQAASLGLDPGFFWQLYEKAVKASEEAS
jgi:tetratricopeptide (TPR) repeat protein